MIKNMRKKCEVVEVITPQQIILQGLYFGPSQAKVGFIYIPGLASNVFSKLDLVAWLAGANFSVLSLNTRGHDKVTRVQKIDKRTVKGYRSIRGGGAHEIFTECKDDVAGAVDFLLKKKIKNIYLVGHSTGCQKAIYYLAHGRYREKVKGAVLLCPMSDYAAAVKEHGLPKLKKITAVAKRMIKNGREHDLLPLNLWPSYDDAQRFISLYNPDSPEEIFSYISPQVYPKTLTTVKQPLLALLAGQDEYQDRPTKQIAAWFNKYLSNSNSQVTILTNAKHSLLGYEKLTAELIQMWQHNLNKQKITHLSTVSND